MNLRWKKYLTYIIIIIIALGLGKILLQIILAGYSAAWTGFGNYKNSSGDIVRGKTLWDWMDLLVIPLVLAIGAFFLNRSERAIERQTAENRIKEDRQIAENRSKLEREIAIDLQQETALQSYLDRMAELLLKEKLRSSENEEAKNVARTRTLTVLRGLDASRKGLVIRFLKEANLIDNVKAVINLHNADISNVNLEGANLGAANLKGAYLKNASFKDAYLEGANFGDAHLELANLDRAYLEHAYLNGASLGGANLELANLEGASLVLASLGGANLEGAHLVHANLENANLGGTDLKGAHLNYANLGGANLNYANLEGANLVRANLLYTNLEGANLEGANLEGANVTTEQLATTKSLKGATMPDGTKHD